MKNTAHIYGRVSKNSQAGGSSLEIQLDKKEAELIAEKYDCLLSNRIYEDSGKSAFSGENLAKGDLSLLIDDIHTNKIKSNDLIILRSLDRFSRANVSKAVSVFSNLLNKGIRFYTTMDSRLYSQKDITVNLVMASLIFQTANEESFKKSSLMNSFILKRISQFKNGERGVDNLPYSLGISSPFHIMVIGQERNKVITKHHTNYEIALEIIKKVLNETPLNQIIIWLVDEHNIKMTKVWISNYLKSPSLYGLLEVNVQDRKQNSLSEYKTEYITVKHTLESYYPAVCSKEEFNVIQLLLEKNKKYRTGVKNQQLLSGRGMLFCGCGQSLATNYVKKYGSVYYSCIDENCNNREQIYILNNIISSVLSYKLLEKSNQIDNVAITEKINKYQSHINELLVKHLEFKRLIELDPVTYGEMLKTSITDNQSKIDQFQSKIDYINSTNYIDQIDNTNEDIYKSIIEELSSIREELLHGSIEQNIKNGGLIAKIIERITVYKDGLITIKIFNGKEIFYYIPDQIKTNGQRYGAELFVFDREDDQIYLSMNNSVDFNKVTFSKSEIINKSYISLSLEEIKPHCKLLSKESTRLVQDQIFIKIKEQIKKDCFFIMDTKYATKVLDGVNTKQIYTHKKYILDNLTTFEYYYYNQRKVKTKLQIIFKNDDDNKYIENVNKYRIDHDLPPIKKG